MPDIEVGGLPTRGREFSSKSWANGDDIVGMERMKTQDDDRRSLRTLFWCTSGPEWTQSTGWSENERDLSKWCGVEVENGAVTLIDLQRKGLIGCIPEDLSKLYNLRVLSLRGNNLKGCIQPALGKLSSLETLSLRNNKLGGKIPPELGKLPCLKHLFLGNNNLTGAIPVELAKLRELKQLCLGDNELDGDIPLLLADLTQLEDLVLCGNNFTGCIPAALSRLTYLMRLELDGNQLTGGIPPELGDLSHLKLLFLDNNNLSGEIPPELGRLSCLYRLDLSHNQLSGCIPPELGDIYSMHILQLNDNLLEGGIPLEFGQLLNIELLCIGGNALAEPLPPIGGVGLNQWMSIKRKAYLKGSDVMGRLAFLEKENTLLRKENALLLKTVEDLSSKERSVSGRFQPTGLTLDATLAQVPQHVKPPSARIRLTPQLTPRSMSPSAPSPAGTGAAVNGATNDGSTPPVDRAAVVTPSGRFVQSLENHTRGSEICSRHLPENETPDEVTTEEGASGSLIPQRSMQCSDPVVVPPMSTSHSNSMLVTEKVSMSVGRGRGATAVAPASGTETGTLPSGVASVPVISKVKIEKSLPTVARPMPVMSKVKMAAAALEAAAASKRRGGEGVEAGRMVGEKVQESGACVAGVRVGSGRGVGKRGEGRMLGRLDGKIERRDLMRATNPAVGAQEGESRGGGGNPEGDGGSDNIGGKGSRGSFVTSENVSGNCASVDKCVKEEVESDVSSENEDVEGDGGEKIVLAHALTEGVGQGWVNLRKGGVQTGSDGEGGSVGMPRSSSGGFSWTEKLFGDKVKGKEKTVGGGGLSVSDEEVSTKGAVEMGMSWFKRNAGGNIKTLTTPHHQRRNSGNGNGVLAFENGNATVHNAATTVREADIESEDSKGKGNSGSLAPQVSLQISDMVMGLFRISEVKKDSSVDWSRFKSAIVDDGMPVTPDGGRGGDPDEGRGSIGQGIEQFLS